MYSTYNEMGVLDSRVLILTGMGWDSRGLLKVDFIGLKGVVCGGFDGTYKVRTYGG